jgi:hypothetical protein
MKFSRALFILLLGLFVFSTSSAFACSGSCSGLDENSTSLSVGKAFGAAAGAVRISVNYTAQTSVLIVKQAPRQIAAIPDAVSSVMADAHGSAGSLVDRSMGLLADAGHAVLNFSVSLLRIVFASFLSLT